LFSMMVIMALVTTFITTPLLHWVYPDLKAVSTTRKIEARVSPAPEPS